MFKYLMLFGFGYALGSLKSKPQPSEWLEDVLIQGFASDQVASFEAPADVTAAAKAASSATGIPAVWFAKLAELGAQPLKFITAAKAMIAQAIAIGPPQSKELGKWRESVLQAGLAAGR